MYRRLVPLSLVKCDSKKPITEKDILEAAAAKEGSLESHRSTDSPKHEHHTVTESTLRYAGYSAVFARAFRYLAFTSDFGEAFRPIVSPSVVNATYAVAIGYCFADVGWEAYKLRKRGYVNEHTGKPMTMTQLVVERSIFQAIASVIVPFLVIHTTVDTGKKVFKKIGKFQKWGPTVLGLSIIPFLPLCLDEPVEKALEYTFENYGPWAEKSHKD